MLVFPFLNSLQAQQEELWGDQVTVVSCDMRDWNSPEKADILVSELLGSFGDNELSPECLDGAQKFLKGWCLQIKVCFLSCFPFLREKQACCVHIYTCLHISHFKLFNQLTNFHPIWYEGHINLVLFDFIQSVITMWQTHKFVRWEWHYIHLI